MESISIVRKTNNLGRIILPVEIRKILNIEVKDDIEIFIEDDQIILRKYKPACIFCGSADKVIDFKGKKVCEECLATMSQ